MSSKNGIFCFLIFFLVSEKKDLTWIKNHKKIDFLIFEVLSWNLVQWVPIMYITKCLHRFSTFRYHKASGSFTSLDFQIQGIQLKFGTFIPYYLYIRYVFHFRDKMVPIDPFPRRWFPGGRLPPATGLVLISNLMEVMVMIHFIECCNFL